MCHRRRRGPFREPWIGARREWAQSRRANTFLRRPTGAAATPLATSPLFDSPRVDGWGLTWRAPPRCRSRPLSLGHRAWSSTSTTLDASKGTSPLSPTLTICRPQATYTSEISLPNSPIGARLVLKDHGFRGAVRPFIERDLDRVVGIAEAKPNLVARSYDRIGEL